MMQPPSLSAVHFSRWQVAPHLESLEKDPLMAVEVVRSLTHDVACLNASTALRFAEQ